MEIGDKIKVVDRGCTYSTFDIMFKNMGFKNPLKQHNSFINGRKAIIFSKGVHPNEGINLYGIQDPWGRQSLINENGIKLIR